MIIFPHFNASTPCAICGGTDDKPATLIQVDGTEDEDGRICEGMQVHVECVRLRMCSAFPNDPDERNMTIYQIFNDKRA